MICPKCSAVCDEELRFCDACGADLISHEEDIPVILVVEHNHSASAEPEAPVIAPEYVPEPAAPAPDPAPVSKKGRLWPPLLILALMICAGTLLFFLMPGTTPDPSGPADPSASWFTVENGVLSFHAEHYTGSAELTIPETVDGQTVTAIADYAFSGQDAITTVILPETVTVIGDYAFSSCQSLRGIYIPTGVRSIGVYAFADCDSLEAIYLPGDLEELGHDSLDSCDGLRYILYNGTYAQWTRLYSGYFTSDVELHTIDGTYYAQP